MTVAEDPELAVACDDAEAETDAETEVEAESLADAESAEVGDDECDVVAEPLNAAVGEEVGDAEIAVEPEPSRVLLVVSLNAAVTVTTVAVELIETDADADGRRVPVTVAEVLCDAEADCDALEEREVAVMLGESVGEELEQAVMDAKFEGEEVSEGDSENEFVDVIPDKDGKALGLPDALSSADGEARADKDEQNPDCVTITDFEGLGEPVAEAPLLGLRTTEAEGRGDSETDAEPDALNKPETDAHADEGGLGVELAVGVPDAHCDSTGEEDHDGGPDKVADAEMTVLGEGALEIEGKKENEGAPLAEAAIVPEPAAVAEPVVLPRMEGVAGVDGDTEALPTGV